VKVLCAFGRHAYGDPRRGESYEYTNFVPALVALGHEVVLFDTWDRSLFPDFLAMNRAFLGSVEREVPDVIFCVLMGYELWQETLELTRRAGAVLVNWATDDSWKYSEFSRFVASAFDIYATTDRGAVSKARRDGHGNFTLTQWAASGERLAKPKLARQCRYPVSFIGAAYGSRRRWIDSLNTQGIAVTCFGHGWERGAIPAETIPEIVRDSVVSLNFSDSSRVFAASGSGGRSQIKARVFEVTGMGGCLLTQETQDLDRYFVPNKEIETFSTPTELVQKIRLLLDNPEYRDAVALAGHARVRQEHTYERRFQKLFATMPVERRHSHANRGRIEWGEFERCARVHQLSAFLRVFAKFLRTSCSMIWGPRRGPRAARRLVYEVSWRVAGRATYRAGGWPGRMFYQES